MQQLELDLWGTLKQAAELPELAELSQLWIALESALEPLGTLEQLQMAGDAISKIVGIVQERSMLTLEEVESIYQDEGPVLSAEFFDKFVRQSMAVDFAQFIEPPAALPRIPNPNGKQTFPNDGRSVVSIIDKATLLERLELESEPDDAEAKAKALAVAHVEDISAWVNAIAYYFKNREVQTLPLLELVQEVKLPVVEGKQERGSPLVKIWLALLSGEYKLEQRGSFYDGPDKIWVR